MPALHQVLRRKRDLPEIRGGSLAFSFAYPVRSFQVLLFIKKLDQPRRNSMALYTRNSHPNSSQREQKSERCDPSSVAVSGLLAL
jgi:hypothetical protein